MEYLTLASNDTYLKDRVRSYVLSPANNYDSKYQMHHLEGYFTSLFCPVLWMRVLKIWVRGKFQGMKNRISANIFQMDIKRVFTSFHVQLASMLHNNHENIPIAMQFSWAEILFNLKL